MSVQQQPQDSSAMNDQDCFLHLKAIEVGFSRTRSVSKLEIKFKDESEFKYKSTVFEKADSLHWECDIYVKSQTTNVLTVQKPRNIPYKKQVAEIRLVFNQADFGDDKTIKWADQKSGVNIKLSFGESRPGSHVTQLLANRAVSALATKVAMLDKLDQVSTYLNVGLNLGNEAAQLSLVAEIAVSSVIAALKKFQEIPACHRELVFIMDDLVSVLPVMNLALERIADIEVRGLVQNFVNLVKDVSQKLIRYSSASTLDFIFQNWYKSKTEDVTKLKNQMEHLKLNISFGLNVDIRGGVSEIQAGMTEVREDVVESRQAIAEIRQHQLSEADEKVLDRLRPPKYCSYDPSRCCLPGTRTSVLGAFERWALNEDNPSRLHWIYGVAGCGKSSVAASVASALDSQKVLCGSFFCKRDDPERRDPTRLVGALAYFLAVASMPFSNVLIRVLKDDPTILIKSLLIQYRALLVGPLLEVSQLAHPDPVYIVVDALDECDDNRAMSECFTEMIRVAPWLRLIITSRPVQEISDGLRKSEELVSRDLFQTDAYDDILSYSRAQFSSEGPLKDLKEHVSEIQIQGLARKSWGLFIWIATVLSYVGKLMSGKVDAIEDILSSAPATNPEGELDALYLRVLNTVTGSSPANITTVRMIIGLIFVTSKNRLLPSSALYAFLSSVIRIVPQELERALRELGSVITTDLQTNTIRVCHPSFLDFVGSQTRSGDFWTETVNLDTIMARKCFQIMKTDLKFNICTLESSYPLNEEVHDLKERVNRCISQELQYSCLYWLNHLSESQLDPSEESVRQMLHDLLCQTASLYWLEAMSLMSELKIAAAILRRLPEIYKPLKKYADLHRSALDLYRFVMAYHQPMSASTPHIYTSALLWAPSESTMAKSLSSRFISRRCFLQGCNKNWPVNLQTLPSSSSAECVAYSPDGSHIISGSGDNTICIWDAQSGTQVGKPLRGHSSTVNSVAYSPDGSRIVSGSGDRTIRIWDAQSGTQVGKPLRGHSDTVLSVAYSPDGSRIISGSSDKTICIWDAQSGSQVGKLLHGKLLRSSAVTSVVYSPDGSRIISGSWDKTICIWDTQSGTQVGEPLGGHSKAVLSVAYSPDGSRIVSGSFDDTIRIWDAQSGTQIGEPLHGHSRAVSSIAYSPDRSHIVSGSWDKTICIWDAQGGIQAGEPLRGHTEAVEDVAYSPDGSRIVSGSSDSTICIWDAHSGTQVGEPLRGHSDAVLSVAYSPDGRHIG